LVSKNGKTRLEESISESSGRRAGLWLGLAVLLALLVVDFFYAGFTRKLVFGQATIAVSSDPPGAKVIADTQTLGITPLEQGKLLPGSYVLRVEHPHFEPVREKIVVQRGDALERSVTLERAYGTLRLVSNPRGAAIRLNGELQEVVTPATLEHQLAGIYDVELSLDGRSSVRERLELQRGARATLSGELERVAVARLMLDLTPDDAQVEIVGFPGVYEPKMKLPPGTYELAVSREGYATARQSLRLPPGSTRIPISLQRLRGQLSVSVSPSDAQIKVVAGGETLVYSQPLSLPTGRVRVIANKRGFRSTTKSVELGTSGVTVALSLDAYEVRVGRKFRDTLVGGGQGPELVVLAAGSFRMGDLLNVGDADERPVHRVALQAPFAIGLREVSRQEWALQFAQTSAPIDAQLPVTNVGRDEIESYLGWLSQVSGGRYRLPSEAEWEFAARAGSDALYGVTQSQSDLCAYANVADATMARTFADWVALDCDDGYLRLAPTGSFAPNAYGLFDVIGNASEWLGDCWHDSYKGAPTDGRAWGNRCSAWVARGGSWDTVADNLRVSFRTRVTRADKELGFRVAKDL